MAYKRYIKRGKKLYGPYIYHSVKKNGKVISEYHGKAKGKKKKKLPLIITLTIITILSLILIANYAKSISPTSSVISEESENSKIAFTGSIIEIINAEHLDSDKQFISDIYEQVRELDDIWSETILDGEYVRVTFEKELTSNRDIKIYPRIISGNPRIEVYEIDGTEIIVEFTSLNSNEYNKVLLTNLKGSQDTFDLRVVGGSMEFDHIVDPPPTVTLISPFNGSTISESIVFSSNITDDFNVTNATLYTNMSGSWIAEETRWNGEIPYNSSDLLLLMHFNNESQFGENDTLVYDWSKASANGTCSGTSCPIFNSTGKFGGAYQYDAVDDFFNLGDVDILEFGSSDFTIGAWFKILGAHEGGGSGTLVSKYNSASNNRQWFVSLNASGYLGFSTSPNGAALNTLLSNTNYSLNRWYNVIFVRNSTNKAIYVDGQFESSSGTDTVATGLTAEVHIGALARSTTTPDLFFNGTIDEVAIWNRALSATEILSIYNYTRTKFEPVFQNKTGTDSSKYLWNVLAYDNNSESDWGDSNFSFSVDTTPPTITIDSPTNITFSTGSIDYNITLNEPLHTAYYSIDEGSNFTLDNDTNTHYFNISNNHPSLSDDGLHNITFWVNDTAGNGNESTVFFTIDTTPPQWFDNSSNSTEVGANVLHSIRWIDTALDGYIFSFANGSTDNFVNDTWVAMSGTSNHSNVTKFINSTLGSVIQWRVYSNDTLGRLNVTDIFNYTTVKTPGMNITLTLDPSSTSPNNDVTVYGHINLSNGTDVINNVINIYLNGTLQFNVYGDGNDGALTITAVDTIINNYTYLTGNESAGNITITVNNASEFSAGDEILIIQIQNASGGIPGQSEFKDIDSVSGNNITLSSVLTNSYYSGTFNQTNSTITQIIRVPQYTNVTINSGASITAAAWDGFTGGIVIFRANGTVNVTGDLNVTAKGFRGGPSQTTNFQGGFQGESILGKGIVSTSNNYAGAGGRDSLGSGAWGGGGTGGGYGTAGDDVPDSGSGFCPSAGSYSGGPVYGQANLSDIYMGSGGGGGGRQDDGSGSGIGGDGGGIIIVYAAEKLTVTGTINASGQIGGTAPSTAMGCGGGGSGGSIYLNSYNLTLGTNKVISIKGSGRDPCGGSTCDSSDGGDGRIRLDYNTLSGSTNPAQGHNGTPTPSTQTNSSGDYNYTITAPSTAGIYPVKVNSTYVGIIGENTKNLTVTEEATFPQWFDNSSNSTVIGANVLHSIRWTDNTALDGFIFSFANGTTNSFVNDTWVAFSGTSNHSNVTKFINNTVGSLIQWRIYSNDTAGNLNVTDIFNYTTTLVPTPPIITIDSPTNTTFTTGSIDYNITLDENLHTAFYSIDGGSNLTLDNDTNLHYFNISSNHPSLSDGFHNITFWVNDTVGNGNESTVFFTVDTTLPQWFDNSTNGAVAGTLVKHSVNWTDDTALDGFIFSFANGTTNSFVNDTWVAFSGTSNHSNVTKFINNTVGSLIQWRVYANDTAGNLNVTDTFNYTTTTPLNSVGDRVFNDTNNNGVFDGNDTGLNGIAIRAWNDSNNDGIVNSGEKVIASNKTNSTGHYTFDLADGDYIIQVNYDFSLALIDFRNSTNTLQNVTLSGSDNLGIDFGFNQTNSIGNGTVDSHIKISNGTQGFNPNGLESSDSFGTSIANIGDLDGDGVTDLAVGAQDDENSDDREGAIYILFMQSNGSVNSNVKISDGLQGFNPSGLGVDDRFGSSIANIGDLDGDGVQDLAVGAFFDEENSSQGSEGAIYILFMQSNGSVNSNVKISDGLQGFNPSGLDAADRFGSSIANIGDLDGDGVQDLAVGAKGDENGDTAEGAIYILFMQSNGSVNSNVKISDGLQGFNPSALNVSDNFGSSIANIGDLDGDGITDLAVGAEDDTGSNSSELEEGAIYILFMQNNGSVNTSVKIGDGLSGFNPDELNESDNFGSSIANIGDLDGDGVTDLAVGAEGDDVSQGAIYILFMQNNGSVNTSVEISDGLQGFNPSELNDFFGSSIANIGDLDGDGITDLAVGADTEGAVYILFMQQPDTIAPKWFDNSSNSTVIGANVLHSIRWTDNTALDGFIFSFANGTTNNFINDTWVAFSGTSNHSNVTKFINNTVGSLIQWRIYSNDTSGNLNVTDIFNYTTTAAVAPPPDPGGGGGSPPSDIFTLNKNQISVRLVQGETKEESFIITNLLSSRISITIVHDLEDLMRIQEKSFTIDAKSSKTIIIDTLARETEIPNLYLGKISISGNGITKEILISIEVISKESLLDVVIEILDDTVEPGETLKFKVFLTKFLKSGVEDVTVNYEIRDSNNNTLLSFSDTRAIETTLSYIKELKIPSDFALGDYLLYVPVSYQGKIASASDRFSVVSKQNIFSVIFSVVSKRNIFWLIVLLIILSIIIVVILLHRHLRKLRRLKNQSYHRDPSYNYGYSGSSYS